MGGRSGRRNTGVSRRKRETWHLCYGIVFKYKYLEVCCNTTDSNTDLGVRVTCRLPQQEIRLEVDVIKPAQKHTEHCHSVILLERKE